MGPFAHALALGTDLSDAEKQTVAEKLHEFIGLPVAYLLKANLRVNGGEFEKSLLGSDVTTGRLDTRFSGPTIDPMSKESDYDPQSAANMKTAVQNIRNVSDKLASGQGTLGRLINDDSLYQSAQGTLKKADRALDGMNDSGPISAVGVVANALF